MSTLTQFRAAVANKIGLDNTVSGDQGDIDRWVNEGVIRVLMDTQCYVTAVTVTPGANQDYTLATTVLDILDMYTTSSGSVTSLDRKTLAEINQMRRGSSSTGPARYYALVGANALAFYPTPGAADTVTMYQITRPTALSNGSDDPSATANGGIPTEYHKAIEYWACAEAADQDDDQSSGQGQRYRDWYQQELNRVRKLARRKGGHRLAPAVANPRGRRLWPGDPSADVR